jgi:hypothetical protein
MSRKIGLIALGAALIAGCAGLRQQRNVTTESLRESASLPKEYRANFPEGPQAGNPTGIPQPTPTPTPTPAPNP